MANSQNTVLNKLKDLQIRLDDLNREVPELVKGGNYSALSAIKLEQEEIYSEIRQIQTKVMGMNLKGAKDQNNELTAWLETFFVENRDKGKSSEE